jgi:hypothetical protein
VLQFAPETHPSLPLIESRQPSDSKPGSYATNRLRLVIQ